MGDVVAKATEPALAAIKLAWWRDRLHELDEGKVPAEPRLAAAAAELLPRGIAGADLAGLEEGWATLLEAVPAAAQVGERGARFFAIGDRLLGATDPLLAAAGRLYGIASAARHGRAIMAFPTAEMHRIAGHRFPRRLRPLTMLARLAARDLRRLPAIEPEGTPGRALALMNHRLFGRLA